MVPLFKKKSPGPVTRLDQVLEAAETPTFPATRQQRRLGNCRIDRRRAACREFSRSRPARTTGDRVGGQGLPAHRGFAWIRACAVLAGGFVPCRAVPHVGRQAASGQAGRELHRRTASGHGGAAAGPCAFGGVRQGAPRVARQYEPNARGHRTERVRLEPRRDRRRIGPRVVPTCQPDRFDPGSSPRRPEGRPGVACRQAGFTLA